MAIILVVLAVAAGVVHFYTQSISYVSNFKTNNGFVDYTLFKSLTDFKQITTEVYNLPEVELTESANTLSNFRVSFVEETTTSISFTVVSKNQNHDHKLAQESILKLINNNRFLNNTNAHDLEILEKKLLFLDKKMSQLDSLTMNPTEFTNISSVMRDSYELYIEKLELEEKIESTGKFDIIKPITDIKINKRPIIIFVVLYLILAAFLFLIFSKKEKFPVD